MPSETPESQSTPDLPEIKSLSFGPTMVELGFDDAWAASQFIQDCVVSGILTVLFTSREDLAVRDNNEEVFKTMEIHPRRLGKPTRRLPSQQEKDALFRIMGSDFDNREVFFNARDRMEFPSNQVFALMPYAKFIRAHGITVKEHLKNKQAAYQAMREASRRPGCLKTMLQNAFFLLMVSALSAAAIHAIEPRYLPAMFKKLKEEVKNRLQEAEIDFNEDASSQEGE